MSPDFELPECAMSLIGVKVESKRLKGEWKRVEEKEKGKEKGRKEEKEKVKK